MTKMESEKENVKMKKKIRRPLLASPSLKWLILRCQQHETFHVYKKRKRDCVDLIILNFLKDLSSLLEIERVIVRRFRARSSTLLLVLLL